MTLPSEKDFPINRVKWVHRSRLRGNAWNPNVVATPEMKLLKQSILEDGWATAIVVQEIPDSDSGEGPAYEIVDGFHRWTVSGHDEIYELTDGFVPVCVVAVDAAHARISTIRFNRARGTHGVRSMSDIVVELIDDEGLSYEDLEKRLTMGTEEIKRLYQRGNILKRRATGEFSQAWEPEKK